MSNNLQPKKEYCLLLLRKTECFIKVQIHDEFEQELAPKVHKLKVFGPWPLIKNGSNCDYIFSRTPPKKHPTYETFGRTFVPGPWTLFLFTYLNEGPLFFSLRKHYFERQSPPSYHRSHLPGPPLCVRNTEVHDVIHKVQYYPT